MTWHLVTTDYPPREGGVATWAEGTASALRAAGENVVVYAPRRLGAEGVTGLWGRAWARWAHVWVASQVLPRVRGGDHVLAATWPLATLLVGRTALSVAFHGSDLTRPPLTTGLDRVKQGARLFPVSRFLGGLLAAPHTVLPMPIRPATPARPGDDLLAIARLGPLKGVDHAIRLAARSGRGITIVGDGPARADLEALARQLQVRARFTGRLPHDQIPWDGHHAAVLLSQVDADGTGAEGLGLVLLEAAARGIPTVGSHTGGVPEVAMRVIQASDPLPHFGPEARDEALAFLTARHSPELQVAALLNGLHRPP